MIKTKPKRVNIQPKDFSNRSYYPGTSNNPFHKINKSYDCLSKLPAPFYAVLFGGVFYLISGHLPEAFLYTGFIFLDWLMLKWLPILNISYGKTHLVLVLLAIMRMPFLIFNLPFSIIIQCLGTFLVIYGFFIEPQFPRVSKYHITLPAKRNKTKTIRILHLSDLHMEFITKLEDRVKKKVNELSPDLILFTGDFFNLSFQQHPDSMRDVIRFFNQIDAKNGIFGVTGSPAVDISESIVKIKPALNLELLDDSTSIVKIDGAKIRLIGLGCTHKPDNDAGRLEKLLDDSKTDANILLYHSPDIAPRISSLPIDLQLSGHTHGGQVQLPLLGPIYSSSVYGLKFSSGFYQVNQTLFLIISRGLGLEGLAAPRVRFLSPPEIGLITLEFNQDNVK